MIVADVRPKHHSYSVAVIQMAISFVLSAGMSFRAANRAFVCIALYFQIEMTCPSHTTILNWTKKQGVSNFREKQYFTGRKWILFADESIQFGNKKLMFVTAVPVEASETGRYLKYSDLTPLVIKVSASWTAEKIAESVKAAISVEDVAYAVSDLCSNLVKAFKLLGIVRVDDVNHKFSWMMQKLFENDETFKSCMKHLSDMRAKLSMSEYAHMVPPNQRIMSRYMNLTPLFEWGVKMLELMATDRLSKEEKARLSFLSGYKTFVKQTYELLCTMNKIQKLLKTDGLSELSVKSSMQLLSEMDNPNSLKIKAMITEYFEASVTKIKDIGDSDIKKFICSTDIIESCFGKFKELVKTSKTVGISDLALCLSAMLSNMDNIKSQMEATSIKELKQWVKDNIGQTLFGQKKMMLKGIKAA